MAKTQTKPVNKSDEDLKTALAPIEKNIADTILNRISHMQKAGGINFPKDYSFANALKSAWLIIQKTVDKNGNPASTVCTKLSIANSLLDMVIQGLSPSKKQCYFIVRGKELCMDRSYFGTVAVTKRLSTVDDCFARVVYKEDEFEYHIEPKTLDIVIDKHNQKFENIDPDKVKGAYAVIKRNNGSLYVEPMTFKQIQRAWNQGPMKGDSKAHKNFTEEMSKKSVLNRGCKIFINTSDDSDLLIESINRTTEAEYIDYDEELIQEEIEQKANKISLDIPAEHDSGDAPDNNKQKDEPALSGPGF